MEHHNQLNIQQGKQQTSSAVNLCSGLDYKQLQKTMVEYQKAEMQMQRTAKLSSIKGFSSTKSKDMINFKALENAGILNLNNQNQENKKIQGIQICEEDIKKAFKILDEKNEGNKISLQELKKKIPAINPNFPLQEIPALTQGKSEMKSKELYELLKQNELEHFDPLQEAFSLLEQKPDKNDKYNQESYIDLDRLEKIFTVLGYSSLDKKDREILLQCLGKDGKITLNDLREIFDNER